jgi:sporulation protein YlmC with PRC-barrel domain
MLSAVADDRHVVVEIKSLPGCPLVPEHGVALADDKRRDDLPSAHMSTTNERNDKGYPRVVRHQQPENSMRIIPAIIVACALATPTMAQVPANTPSAAAAPIVAAGQWRASKLIGVNVYNEQNEKVGAIDELIVDSNGRVAGAVVGVGGFLGMGEHEIMLSMDKLKFSNEAGKTTTGTTTSNVKQWYPDRAVINANKDQLKAMPQFKY